MPNAEALDLRLILEIAIAALLVILVILQIVGRRRTSLRKIERILAREGDEQRESVARQLSEGATEQFRRFGVIQESLQQSLTANREAQDRQLDALREKLDERITQIAMGNAQSNDRINENVSRALQASRMEQSEKMAALSGQMDSRLEAIQKSGAENAEKINQTLESRMKAIQESNEARLQQMQTVVDEKLQKTLEERLSKSFELVGKQLDSVQQGLGEMKNLAADARSLKNALTNVKERGTYGEVRLEKLLSDILAPGQFAANVEIADNKRVEFVVLLPGTGEGQVMLPIDSKFPIEDYNRLLDAQERQGIDEARKALVQRLRAFAKEISDKYIRPPKTTDFALMFLPTEGLYAEAVRDAALFEEMREKYHVTAVGATTLSAFLSSLQLGFKTLAIEQRSQEVWNTLRAVKGEFVKFGDMLDKAHKQLQTADKTLEEIVGRRTKAINRQLRSVEEMTDGDWTALQAGAEDEEDAQSVT